MRFFVGILSSFLAASFLFVASSTFADTYKEGKELPLPGKMIVLVEVKVIETPLYCYLRVSDLNLGEYIYHKQRKELSKTKNDQQKLPPGKITAECTTLPDELPRPRIIIINNADDKDHKHKLVEKNPLNPFGSERLKGVLKFKPNPQQQSSQQPGKEEESDNTKLTEPLPYDLLFPTNGLYPSPKDNTELVIGTITEQSKEETITIEGELDLKQINENLKDGTYKDIKGGKYRDTLNIELTF
jgi:hypothetical protein